MPLAFAGKIVVFVSFILLSSGVLRLQRALHGRHTFWFSFSFLFLFNFAFMFGMVNFIIGCGLLLHALAVWLDQENRDQNKQLLYGFLFSLLLFFTHLYALAVYGLFIAVLENTPLTEKLRPLTKNFWFRNARTGAQFVPPILIFFFLSPTSGAALSNFVFDPVPVKIAFLTTMNFFPYSYPFNTLLLAAMIGFVFYARLPDKKPQIIEIGLITLLLYFLMPKILLSSHNADWRILLPLPFIAAAYMAKELARRQKIIFGITIVALLLLQDSIILHQWRKAEQRYQDMWSVISSVPEGVMLYPAVIYPGAVMDKDDGERLETASIMHFFNYAVIEKKVFMPLLFTFKSQQPLSFKPPYDTLARDNYTGTQVFDVHKDSWDSLDWGYIRNYDYALIAVNDKNIGKPPTFAYPVARAGIFHLYRIDKTNG